MRLLSCSLALMLIASFASAQSATPSDEKQLMELETAYEKVINSHDAASIALLDKHLTDSVIGIDLYGNLNTQTRQQIVDDLRRSDPGVTSMYKQSNYRVSVTGSTAVVTYQTVSTFSGLKNPLFDLKDFSSTCMDIFIKRNNEWYGWATNCTPTQSAPQATYDAAHKK